MYVYVYAFLTQCMVTSTSDISIELRREPIWPCWRARKRFRRANLQPVPTFRSSPVCVHSLISLKIQSRAYTFVWLMCISHGYTFTYIYMIIHVSMLACTYQTNVNTDPIGQAYLDLRSEENPFEFGMSFSKYPFSVTIKRSTSRWVSYIDNYVYIYILILIYIQRKREERERETQSQSKSQ